MLSLSDHRIIYRFSYQFYKINLHFKNNYEQTLFANKTKFSKMFINGFMVSPHYLNIYRLLIGVKHAKIFTASSQGKVEDYVSFSRANFSPLVQSWCDWCSISNGYFSFLIAAINEYYQCHDIDSIPYNSPSLIKLKLVLIPTKYLTLMLDREALCSSDWEEISPALLFPDIYEKAPYYLQKLLKLISKLYNTVQLVEQQWCPFEHMKRIALLAQGDKKQYEHYVKCERFAAVIKAGELLFNFKHLKCQHCVTTINESVDAGNLEHNKSYPKTEDFFKLICRLSR